MSIGNFFKVHHLDAKASTLLLIARVVIGLAMMHHGWNKIQNPFEWMGPDSPTPGIFQALAALSEFGGGLAWILGLLTPLASLGVFCTMIVAVHMHAIVRGDPFYASGGGKSYELAAMYLSYALTMIAVGPGQWSLDQKIFGRRR